MREREGWREEEKGRGNEGERGILPVFKSRVWLVQTGLELLIFYDDINHLISMLTHSECWDYRCLPRFPPPAFWCWILNSEPHKFKLITLPMEMYLQNTFYNSLSTMTRNNKWAVGCCIKFYLFSESHY